MKSRASYLRFALVLAALLAKFMGSAEAQQRVTTPTRPLPPVQVINPDQPAPPRQAPPRRECAMAGLWSANAGSFVTDYSADGRWHTYYSVADARRATPALSGTFMAEGNAIRFVILNQPQSEGFLYRVTVTGNACESLHLVLVSSPNNAYQAGFTIDFQRVTNDQQ